MNDNKTRVTVTFAADVTPDEEQEFIKKFEQFFLERGIKFRWLDDDDFKERSPHREEDELR